MEATTTKTRESQTISVGNWFLETSFFKLNFFHVEKIKPAFRSLLLLLTLLASVIQNCYSQGWRESFRSAVESSRSATNNTMNNFRSNASDFVNTSSKVAVDVYKETSKVASDGYHEYFPTIKQYGESVGKTVSTYGSTYGREAIDWGKKVSAEYGPKVSESVSSMITKYGPQVNAYLYEGYKKYGPEVVRTVSEIAQKYGPEVALMSLTICQKYGPEFTNKLTTLVEQFPAEQIYTKIQGAYKEYGPVVGDFLVEQYVNVGKPAGEKLLEFTKIYGRQAGEEIIFLYEKSGPVIYSKSLDFCNQISAEITNPGNVGFAVGVFLGMYDQSRSISEFLYHSPVIMNIEGNEPGPKLYRFVNMSYEEIQAKVTVIKTPRGVLLTANDLLKYGSSNRDPRSRIIAIGATKYLKDIQREIKDLRPNENSYIQLRNLISN